MAPPSEETPTVTRMTPARESETGLRASLRVVGSQGPPWSLWLEQQPRVVGRTAADDASSEALVHGTVSRKHAELSYSNSRACHVIRDLGSHNGTRVDGRDVGSVRVALVDQSVVQLGDVTLVYEVLDAASTDPANAAYPGIPGSSPSAARVRERVRRAAVDPSPALLIGETGTGKEWIARELHARSERSGPLVAINCAALSPQIIDSQLFGHVKGAFTGATSDQPGMFRAAEGGTLFLDEIGELPLELQPKLLRALQEREVQPVGSTKLVRVDVRVVAATNVDLAAAVDHGRFRRDLYARLAMWELQVPALRQRKGDLPLWIERLHERWLEERPGQSSTAVDFTPEALERILLFDWPNNLRQLDRFVHTLATGTDVRPIPIDALPSWVTNVAPPAASVSTSAAPPVRGPEKPPVPTEDEFVVAYRELDGNVRALAKRFARDRRQIYRWIEAYGLRADRG